MTHRPFVLGIAGGSGSGKSTLVERLRSTLPAALVGVLPQDAYYLNREQMPPGARDNWDHPEALENTLYASHIDELLAGRAVHQPVYDFSHHRRSSRVITVEARPVIVLEGILLLSLPEIRQRIDLRVFIDTPAEERIVRRILRDITERSRTVESVVEQFRTTVRPMHDRYVEPSRVHAHLIVPWDWAHDPQPAIEVLLARLRSAAAATTTTGADS